MVQSTLGYTSLKSKSSKFILSRERYKESKSIQRSKRRENREKTQTTQTLDSTINTEINTADIETALDFYKIELKENGAISIRREIE